MTPEQKAAFISAQTACAVAEIAGMEADNMQRQALGQSMAWTKADFEQIPYRYGIDQNSVLGFFR